MSVSMSTMCWTGLRQLVLNRVEEDRGDSLTDEISISKVLHHLVCLIMCVNISASSLKADWTIWALVRAFNAPF
jgi:hypothetical protein